MLFGIKHSCVNFTKGMIPFLLNILYQMIYSQYQDISKNPIKIFSSLGGARRHGGQFSNLREDKENIPHEVTAVRKHNEKDETEEKCAF